MTGLAKYDAMCAAIAVCSRVDEAKEIRDKARALEVYAKQALNTEAERKAAEIRLRAERRAGQLLREMKQRGERQDRGDNRRKMSNGATSQITLPDLGITRDQSSQWQQLAEIPEQEFEAEITRPDPKPTTEGLLHSRRAAKEPANFKMDRHALWVWGRIKDFERNGIIQSDPATICAAFTDPMRDDVTRILPELIHWLKVLEAQLSAFDLKSVNLTNFENGQFGCGERV
jgi:hypothetical protein